MEDLQYQALLLIEKYEAPDLTILLKKLPTGPTIRDKNIALSNLAKQKLISEKLGKYRLTESGALYLQSQRSNESRKAEMEALSFEKLQYDVKNAKRVFKTYWWTFGFSVAALIISLALAILKIIGL